MTLPEIIRCKFDGVLFAYWLANHPEITHIQGWAVRRTGTMPSYFGEHYADEAWLWSERRALNDWIRTYRARHADDTLPDSQLLRDWRAAGSRVAVGDWAAGGALGRPESDANAPTHTNTHAGTQTPHSARQAAPCGEVLPCG